jgi:hypothetical protein
MLYKLDRGDRRSAMRSEYYRALVGDFSRRLTSPNARRLFAGFRDVGGGLLALARLKSVTSGYAATSRDVAKIVKTVDANSEWLVANSNTRHISNLAWAVATLSIPAPALFRAIDERSAFLVENGTSRDISITAWAFAANGAKAPNLFRKINEKAAAVTSFVESWNAQSIANTAWAAATLNCPAPAFFANIDEHSAIVAESGSPQAIANTAWAFATLGCHAPGLFAKLDARSAFLVENGTSQNVSNTLWAFATLGFPAPSLLEKIEEGSSSFVEKAKPQELANSAWALSSLRYDAVKFFSALDTRSAFIVEQGNAQAIGNTAIAFAELGIQPEAFFAYLEENPDRFLGSATKQSLCNVCFSLAILGLVRQHDALLELLWTRLMKSCVAATLTDKGWSQLVLIELHASASGVSLSVPSPHRRRMVEAAAAEYAHSPRGKGASMGESEYSRLLTEMGFEHERELSPVHERGRLLAIDFACPDRKVAVEYDGKFHYLSSGRETGRTVAKRRLLESLGWKVVNICYRDEVLMVELGAMGGALFKAMPRFVGTLPLRLALARRITRGSDWAAGQGAQTETKKQYLQEKLQGIIP